jgi:hypothetical protein
MAGIFARHHNDRIYHSNRHLSNKRVRYIINLRFGLVASLYLTCTAASQLEHLEGLVERLGYLDHMLITDAEVRAERNATQLGIVTAQERNELLLFVEVLQTRGTS